MCRYGRYLLASRPHAQNSSLYHWGGPRRLHCSLWARPDHRCEQSSTPTPKQSQSNPHSTKNLDLGFRDENENVFSHGSRACMSGTMRLWAWLCEDERNRSCALRRYKCLVRSKTRLYDPQKERMREAASSQFLVPNPWEDQLHLRCLIQEYTPLYLYNCPFQFQTRYCMGGSVSLSQNRLWLRQNPRLPQYPDDITRLIMITTTSWAPLIITNTPNNPIN